MHAPHIIEVLYLIYTDIASPSPNMHTPHIIEVLYLIYTDIASPSPHACTHLILLKFYIKELKTTYECI